MADDPKLTEDEARRRAQHEKVKKHLGDEAQAEILKDADRIAPDERLKAEEVGHELKRKAIGEVAATERELQRQRVFARLRQVVDYVFGVVYALIGLQVLLEMIGARERAGFKHLMNTITSPILGPFRGLVTDPAVGRFQFMLSYVVALLVYVLLHVGIRGLIRLLAQRRTSL
jgi:uncharacterized protein YggT (Ycf19 family)